MKYLVVSFSHKNTDLALREKLSFNPQNANLLLERLLGLDLIDEAILLSTCNRMEIFMLVGDSFGALQSSLECISDIAKLSKRELEGRANTFEGYSAIHHIFLVASSLDSLVVGETQISGQLKKAYRSALNAKYCTSKGLGLIIDFAFKCASNIRNQTEISKKQISIASVASQNALKLNLKNNSALVIGLGEMGKIVTKYLLNANLKVHLANRNKQKAQDFKENLGDLGDKLIVSDLKDLGNLINEFELIFSATGAETAIITQDLVKKCNFKRYFYDLALPRDIDICVDSSINITTIDDLSKEADKNKESRKAQIDLAYQIVGDETNEFFKYLNILSVEPIIKSLRNLAKNASISEVDKAISKGFLQSSDRNNILKTIHNVFNIFLHTPTKNLKEVASSAQLLEIERTLKMLFDLSDENLEKSSKKHDKDAIKGY